jgi:2-amino-4-hydroxy-6-hydroxymethyldihydropteridine diphosphokinase
MSGGDDAPVVSTGETVVYVGLGSNLERPAEQVQHAFDELDRLPSSRLTGRSRRYRSRPMGPPGQPDYVNAVAQLATRLAPQALLRELQAIERAHRRVRGERWGPRTLDLDLLLYGECKIDTPDLQVPHPGLHERAFVLYPLYEISPVLDIPGKGRLAELIADCAKDGLQPLE